MVHEDIVVLITYRAGGEMAPKAFCVDGRWLVVSHVELFRAG